MLPFLFSKLGHLFKHYCLQGKTIVTIPNQVRFNRSTRLLEKLEMNDVGAHVQEEREYYDEGFYE